MSFSNKIHKGGNIYSEKQHPFCGISQDNRFESVPETL